MENMEYGNMYEINFISKNTPLGAEPKTTPQKENRKEERTRPS